MPASPKRARVMARSKKLGHCICDPRKTCPCDLLLEKDLCPCAGERPDPVAETARPMELTKRVKNAGCASKIPAADLARVLARLPAVKDPRLLIGLGSADDAGVFQVAPDLCLVQTVDVFSPCVDDPYLFGQIAACNSVSDVYAMGGTPVTALSIIGYPIHTLGDEGMYRMIKGGMDKLQEAGVILVGGHSINDEEIKFGFAVTGTIRPDAVIANSGARPGDVLILTKPIGTGIVAFAAQVGRASAESLQAAGASMAALNNSSSAIMARDAHAGTDVTGFGLLGHLCHIVRESGVTAEVWWDRVPAFPGVIEHARQGVVPGATERNREFAGPIVQAGPGVPDYALDLLYDAQTSGGLLMAVPEAKAQQALDDLHSAGWAHAAFVGRILERSKGAIRVTSNDAFTPSARPELSCCASAKAASESKCCSSAGAAAAKAADAESAFKTFMTTAFAPGALDVVQKELMTIALSVAVQCEPCLKIHLEKCRAMGIGREELLEAAWMGVAFGGCKAMMFWEEKGKSLLSPAPGV